MNWVKFKQEHNWLSAVALFNILLAAIGPSFVEWDKPLGKVSNRSTQNSQRSSFERRINNSERNYKDEWNQKHSSNDHAKVDHIIRIDSFSQNNGSTNYKGRTHAENR